jgi:FkbM family methyltransferase
MLTYSQNFEDVMLARLFYGQSKGFYVDVGANHPSRLSVTKHFYELGWNGINIEPIRENWALFEGDRTRDLNLNAAVGDTTGEQTFFVVEDNDALSTCDRDRAAELARAGSVVDERVVPVVTLNSVLDQRKPGQIDFMNIDVEGRERAVLTSIDLHKYRPRVILVEATKSLDHFPGWDRYRIEDVASWSSWEPLLTDRGYVFGHFDGLNRFYVRQEDAHLLARFAVPPGVFDFIIPDLLAADLKTLQEKEAAIQQLAADNLAQGRAIYEKEQQIREKDQQIAYLSRPLWRRVASRGYRFLISRRNRIQSTFRRCVGASFRFGYRMRRRAVRLGVLRQYPPRPLTVPAAAKVQIADPPAISMITPSFQQGRYIEQTIKSVLGQQYPKLEYFIQDGGSTDETVDILRHYEKQLAGWESCPDHGQSEAINRGLARTTGQIMGWINSDDLLLPGALATVAAFFAKHPEIDVVYGNRLIIDEQGQEIGRWILPGHDDKALSWADYVPQETLFWRRAIWEKVGGKVDESFRFAMDWDLLVRFRDAGAQFAHLPYFIGAFRAHAEQKTSASIEDIGFAEMCRVRAHVFGRIPSPLEIDQAIRGFLFRHAVADLRYELRQRAAAVLPSANRRAHLRTQ